MLLVTGCWFLVSGYWLQVSGLPRVFCGVAGSWLLVAHLRPEKASGLPPTLRLWRTGRWVDCLPAEVVV